MNRKVILIDCDGVLTDGRLHIDHTGEKMFKAFHTRDVRAIRELIFLGYEVVIVTADDWPGIHHFAKKVGAIVEITRDKGMLAYHDYIAIGDDAWDVPMLKKASRAYAPADADPSVFVAVPRLLKLDIRGGEGCVAAVLRDLA